MQKTDFHGSIVALVTPFDQKKAVDFKALGNLLEWHIQEKTDAILVCGCTGEAATLSPEEHLKVISFAKDAVAGRVPVLAGTGSNNTTEALYLTGQAETIGVDAALIITPYYNKPTPAGLLLHYTTIADRVKIPLILYNVPSRTGISLLPETVAELSRKPNIVAIKEASGSLDQVSAIREACADSMTVLSGDDSLTLPIMALGGTGVISTAANVIPAAMARLTRAALSGDFPAAREIHYRHNKLFRALFYETNPIPVKTVLAWMGKIRAEWRPPLCPMSRAAEEQLRTVVAATGLIPPRADTVL